MAEDVRYNKTFTLTAFYSNQSKVLWYAHNSVRFLLSRTPTHIEELAELSTN